MKIGIIGGNGVVGSTLAFGFQNKLGHTVKIHDIKLDTKIQSVLDCEICYICVPTPCKSNGECDTKIVEGVVYDLMNLNYHGIICIKSTIEPGTTQRLIDQYKNDKICHSIETLRERCPVSDFIENLTLLAVGTNNDDVFNKIVECHGRLPKNILKLDPTSAEILKYAHNTVNALRIVFANEIYEICTKIGADYNKVKEGLLKTTHLPDQYLDCNDATRSYSSICLNKDIPALRELSKKLGLNLKLLNIIEEANNQFKKTPFKDTRESY